jgi:hypothetical protein
MSQNFLSSIFIKKKIITARKQVKVNEPITLLGDRKAETINGFT